MSGTRYLGEQAKEMAISAREKTKEIAASVAGAVSSVLRDKADAIGAAVGECMKSTAGALRKKAPPDGIIGTATGTVARTLETGGEYLEHQGVGGMCKDLAGTIRKHPLPALLVAMGVGFLLARATRRR